MTTGSEGPSVVWTNRAVADIEEIYYFVAADKPEAASRLAEKLMLAGDSLGEHPHLGRAGRSGGIRELVVGNYLLVYRIMNPKRPEEKIEILSVVHGAQRRRR